MSNMQWKENYHQSLEHLHIGCEPPHAYIIPYDTDELAQAGERSKSARFASLCGTWQFRYYPSLEDLSDIESELSSEKNWDSLTVP